MRSLRRRNRDALLVAVVAASVVALLNAIVPELRDAIVTTATSASWLVRPMRWPQILVILLFAPLLVLRRR
jgi:hypothetical protein